MEKHMKKIILCSLLLASTQSFADTLHNFNDVKSAVLTGKSIHIVVDFSKCGTLHNQSMSAGIFTPNEIGVTDNHIATSLTHFTLNNPAYPNKPVNDFVRYTISDDTSVSVKSQALAATTYEPLESPSTVSCKIDEGVTIYA
jgi:hypothetical protein